MKLTEIKINEMYKATIPRPNSEEFESLKQDISLNGIQLPLLVNRNNVLLDGHTRYDIALSLGLDSVPTDVRFFESEDLEFRFVIMVNVLRRSLTPAQKVELGVLLLPVEERLAKARQEKTQIKKGSNVIDIAPTTPQSEINVFDGVVQTFAPPKGKVRDIIAKQIEMSHSSFDKGRKIIEVAKTNPQVAREWENAKQGKTTINKIFNNIKLQETQEKLREKLKENQPLEINNKQYNVILADPPWEYATAVTNRKIENKYPTMPIDDICNLKIPAMKDCVLFLWATMPKLREALLAMESWGFEYKTGAVWDKQKIGMGYYFRGQHELLLVGRKGTPGIPSSENRPPSIISEMRKEHSQKPDKVYELIEKMYPNCLYLEMFARKKHSDSWDVWGDEVK